MHVPSSLAAIPSRARGLGLLPLAVRHAEIDPSIVILLHCMLQSHGFALPFCTYSFGVFRRLLLLLLKPDYKFADLLGRGCRPKDLERVLFERLDPASDVRCVLRRVVP